MAFPTIPTVAAGRVLTLNQLNTTATRTFPALSGLTKNAGDLLIAIIVAYQTSTGTNAAFSGWSGGFTEFHDSATSTTLAIGMAYKWSDGTETAAPTVTQAGTITGDASMILLSIPGAHTTTPPEAGSRASGTTAGADPASFDPAGWASEDTLWISVIGNGMTNASGSWTGTDATAPTNFTNRVDTNAADTSTIGDVEAAVSFRQQNASAQDVAAAPGDLSNARNAAVVIAVRPLPPPKSTSVARVSLGSYGEPSTRTAHSIKVRARTTSGSTGVLKAALYEGANDRSGELTSSALTNSLADYTLSIPDASAANITSYSDLEIRFWGYDPNGGALVFEVADLYLEVPASAGPSTYYGVTALPVTFTKSVVGFRQTFSLITAPFTFTKAVSGARKTFSQIAAPFTFTKAVGGVRTALGQIIAPFTFVKAVSATRQTFAQLVRPFTFVKDISAGRTTFGQIVAPFMFVKDVAGIRRSFGQVAAPFTFVKSVSAQRIVLGQTVSNFVFTGVVSGSRKTFSQIVAPFTFVKSVVGRITMFGQIVAPFTFVKSVSGVRNVFGQIAAPFTFVKNVVAQKTTFGQFVAPFTFTKAVTGTRTAITQIIAAFTFNRVITGRKTTFSRVDLPLIFVDQTNASKQTFGQIVFPITIEIEAVAEVQGIRYGRADMSLVFGKDVEAFKQTFGQVSSPYLFERSTQSQRTTFSSLVRPFTFIKSVVAQRTTFGQSSLPINASFVVAGRRLAYGQVALSLVVGEQTAGQREALGQIVSPYNFNRELSGQKETFGRLDLPIDFVVDVNTGRVEAFSALALEFLVGMETAGIVRPTGIILNLAKAIYLGSTPVDAVYVDSQEVWSK